MLKGEKIIHKMLENDAFSKWMGIELISYQEDEVVIKMTVRGEMNNGFYITHGGLIYSFADSAFAFLSNSYGRHAVSIESSISHIAKTQAGDKLWARAQKINTGHKISNYTVEVKNQDDKIVAHFKGTVYISSKEWEVE